MSRAVLIADGNAARGQRIAQACAAHGLSTTLAATGAEALETALADVPDAVVTPADLPLIDGPRLAEILRSNPRTRDARFVFLGRETTLRGGFDVALPPSASAEEVADGVLAALAQRDRFDELEKRAATDHQVEGRLAQVPLTDLVQLFHMNRRTGVLQVRRREPGGSEETGTVWLREGNLLRASVGSVENEKALFRMLAWRDGHFAFTPREVNAPARIMTPTRALLLEGVRQLDEWSRLRETLPHPEARVKLLVGTEGLPQGVHPLTQRVLELLERHDTVRDVVDGCPWPDYQVLRTLQALAERRILETRRDSGALPGTRSALFSDAQVARLRDWMTSGRPREQVPHEAKLLLLSADSDATRDFVRLLSALPGMELSELARRGPVHEDDLLPIGRLAVGDGLALELVHVPASRDFEAVWPVAAHGALGTLALVGSEAGGANDPMGPALAAFSSRPGARMFRVQLLRKGERLSGDDLTQRMAVLDQSSLFLLQLESDRSPVERLRTMFARIMP